MKLECIVTLANRKVRLRFLAMERSLRATGCNLPLKVIPYDDNTFDLPAGSEWWRIPKMSDWIESREAHPTMRKYQALTIPNFQFVDADVIFLRNPEEVLAKVDGFVTSCGHWHNPDETLTSQSRAYLSARSTIWQSGIFNTGQWACDKALYTLDSLIARAEESDFVATCVSHPSHEQPGVNMLVNASGVPIHNLTLPPWNMQSTWAGDYKSEYRHYWRTEEETPYLIHWAGTKMEVVRPINEIFYNYLTTEERHLWDANVTASVQRRTKAQTSLRGMVRKGRNALRAMANVLAQ